MEQSYNRPNQLQITGFFFVSGSSYRPIKRKQGSKERLKEHEESRALARSLIKHSIFYGFLFICLCIYVMTYLFIYLEGRSL